MEIKSPTNAFTPFAQIPAVTQLSCDATEITVLLSHMILKSRIRDGNCSKQEDQELGGTVFTEYWDKLAAEAYLMPKK